MMDTVLLWLLNIGYLVYIAAYAVRDIFWLRLLTIAGGFATIPYFVSNDTMSPVYWTSTYIIINVVNLTLLMYERRPVNLTSDQERLRTLLFRAFSPREFLRFVTPADWRAGMPDERIVAKDTTPDGLMAILEGETIVKVEDKEITRLRMGQFVGEMSFITGQFASADVFSGDNLRYAYFGARRRTRVAGAGGPHDSADHIGHVEISRVGQRQGRSILNRAAPVISANSKTARISPLACAMSKVTPYRGVVETTTDSASDREYTYIG